MNEPLLALLGHVLAVAEKGDSGWCWPAWLRVSWSRNKVFPTAELTPVRGAGARGQCSGLVLRAALGQPGRPVRDLACELPPALCRITQVLPPISEKLTSNKRAL